MPPPVSYCGHCANCEDGHNGFCFNSGLFGSGATFGDLPGGMAEYVRVPNAETGLVKLPDDVSDEQAVLTADMLLTGFYAIREAGIQPGDTLAVVGAGPVGLSAVHVARLYSPTKIILIGRRANRLKTGIEMGATHTIDSDAGDVVAQVKELTGGLGVTAVVETAGNPASVKTAAQVVKLDGTMSLVGAYPNDTFEFPMQTVNLRSLKIMGGLTDVTNMALVIGLVRAGMLDPTPLVTHRMPLSEIEKAFTIFAEKREDALKIILRP